VSQPPNAERLTVGIPFAYQEDWLGGLHYARNVVSALALLPKEQQPHLLVIADSPEGYDYLRTETGYPDLQHVTPSHIRRFRNRRFSLFQRPPSASEAEIDVVLLGSAEGLEARAIQWVPDFQEERFPQFFPAQEVKARQKRNARWFARHRHIMVSSEDVREDLQRFYGRYRNRVHVVPFASFVDGEAGNADLATLREKYSLPDRYFISANQLWRHKNHAVVLRALAELDPGENIPPVVFTGREHDYRDRSYAPSLRALAVELGLGKKVRFLGLLPRADQLALFREAIAVVQPSLCEGWSTVVEDAKALGKHLVASDIAVHREQLDRNVDFFSPDDHRRLAELLRHYRDDDPKVEYVDYAHDRQRFAARLYEVIVEAKRDFCARGADRLLANSG
jgi:glycosyltransferase involved in cell wall biosynthesis